MSPSQHIIHPPGAPPLEPTWFESWFDSPYYEALYDHRNMAEARSFVRNVASFLKLDSGARILDLACGWGRHTRSLSELGYRVTGLDLSQRLISRAVSLSTDRPNLHFVRGDMREFHFKEPFDLILSLFTSFGYFDSQAEDLRVLRNAFDNLQENGYFVLDFLHRDMVLGQLKATEYRECNEFKALITKKFEDPWLVKTILITDKANNAAPKTYSEKVRCYDAPSLKDMLEHCGFTVTQQWGNYHGESPSPDSPRCIFFARKSRTAATKI